MKKILRKLPLLVVVLVLGLTGMAQKLPTDLNAPLPLDPEVTTGTLENGLQYFIRENHEPAKRAELQLVVKAGSICEDEDQLGLAHFCEHMAFNGTKNFPKHELINYLESLGMGFGPEINAFTSFDETVYMIKIPTDSIQFIEKGLLVLSDWAHQVSYEDEEIDKERGVITEEWRLGQGANDRMRQKTFPVLFHQSKYADRLPIGTLEVIQNFKHDVIRRFYKDWYRPDLMAVVVVGDFDKQMMEKKVRDLFGKIPKSVNPRARQTYPIPNHSEPLVTIATDKEATMSMVSMYIKHNQRISKTHSDFRRDIAESLYAAMINKRLSELTLKANPPFMQGFSIYSSFLGPKDVYMSLAITKNGETLNGLEAVMTENNRVRQFGFTATELEREKKALLTQVEKMYKERDKTKSADKANELQRHFLFSQEPVPGIAYEFELYKAFLPTISLEEINQLAREWITPENRVFSINGPDKEGVTYPTEAQVLDLVKKAEATPLSAYVDKVSDKPFIKDMPTPSKVDKTSKDKKAGTTTWKLKNGIEVVLKKTDFKADEIMMSAVSKGGLSTVELNDLTAADVAADVVNESGLGDYDRVELEKYLSDKVANVSPYISDYEEGLRGSCSPHDLETMLQMTYLYFTKARKDEDSFNNYITNTKTMLENNSLSPEGMFRDSISAVMYNHHPRKMPTNPSDLDKVSLKRMMYLYNQRFGDPNNFKFYLVGNIDEKTAKPLIEKYIGGLPIVNRNEDAKDVGIRQAKGAVEKIVYKGNDPKSLVYMNLHGEEPNILSNRLVLEMVSSILSTKLLESIREDSSGVYSIGAYPRNANFPVQSYGIDIYFGCNPSRIDDLVKGIREEMQKLMDQGPSDKDLAKAKEKILRERETNLRENRYWLNSLKNYDMNKEPFANFYQLEEIVRNTDAKAIQVAAKNYFSTENVTKVILKPAL